MNSGPLGRSLKSFMWLQSDDSRGCSQRKFLLLPEMGYSLTCLALDAGCSLRAQLRFLPEQQHRASLWLLGPHGKWPSAVAFFTYSPASKREHPKMSIPRNLGGSYKFSCNLNPRSCSISSLVFY